jgi:hypothetical protein
MPTMTSPEKPQTNASRVAAPMRTLGRGVRPKVQPATDSTGPVQTKLREPKRRAVPGVSVTPRLSIRSAEFVETHDVPPTWCANYWGSLPLAVNFYRSCVRLGCLAQETTGFILVRASKE